MGQYAGQNVFPDDIYTFEETDPVQGGTDGIDNVPIKQLADRDIWLKDNLGRMEHLKGELIIEGSGTSSLPVDIAGKLVIVSANGIYNLTLPDITDIRPGSIIPITTYCGPNCVVNIQTVAGQFIYDNGNVNVVHMHNREHLLLTAGETGYKVVSCCGNFNSIGEEVKARKIIGNTLMLNGQLLQRSQYPRLWKFVSGLTLNTEVVTESTWQSHAVNYKGFFSLGDGVSTFRLPDERGMHERMLDIGRGIDLGRENKPGAYEADALKKHNHQWKYTNAKKTDLYQGRDATMYTIMPAPAVNLTVVLTTEERMPLLDSEGEQETRVKTIGKYNLIKF